MNAENTPNPEKMLAAFRARYLFEKHAHYINLIWLAVILLGVLLTAVSDFLLGLAMTSIGVLLFLITSKIQKKALEKNRKMITDNPHIGNDEAVQSLREAMQLEQQMEASVPDLSDDMLQRFYQKEMRTAGFYSIYTAVGIILAIIGYFYKQLPSIVFFLAGAFLASFGLKNGSSTKCNVKKIVGKLIVEAALNDVFDQVDYRQDEHLPENVISSVKMGMKQYDHITGNDYVKATYKGINIEMSDLLLQDVKDTRYRNGKHEITKAKTIFHGLWMICDFGKELSAELLLAERKSNIFSQLPKNTVDTENQLFNEKFRILSDSPHDVFYILTPHMMECILTMDERANGQTYLRFLQEGKLHIAVNSGRNAFEIGLNSIDDIADLRRTVVNEIHYVTDLIDALRLVDTLYKRV